MAPSMAPVIGSTSSWISKSWRRDASIGTSRPQLRIQILSAQEIQKSYPLPLSDVYVYIYMFTAYLYIMYLLYSIIWLNPMIIIPYQDLPLDIFGKTLAMIPFPCFAALKCLSEHRALIGTPKYPKSKSYNLHQLTITYPSFPPVKRPVKRPSFWDPIDIDGGSNRTTGFPPWPPWRAWSRLTARRRHRTGASLIELDDGNMFNRKARSIWW